MVHETGIIIAKGEVGCCGYEEGYRSYLRIELVDLLNGRLDVPQMDRSTDVYPFLDRINIFIGLNISFHCEFLRSSRVAVGDEVVHD